MKSTGMSVHISVTYLFIHHIPTLTCTKTHLQAADEGQIILIVDISAVVMPLCWVCWVMLWLTLSDQWRQGMDYLSRNYSPALIKRFSVFAITKHRLIHPLEQCAQIWFFFQIIYELRTVVIYFLFVNGCVVGWMWLAGKEGRGDLFCWDRHPCMTDW